MNTYNTAAGLPPAFSPLDPTFASKAAYLDFVREWRAVYRRLSLLLRAARLGSRLRPDNRPEKKAALEKELAALQARLAAGGPCPYLDHGVEYQGVRLPVSASLATWLLELRAAAKLDAGRRRAAALAARTEPPGSALAS